MKIGRWNYFKPGFHMTPTSRRLIVGTKDFTDEVIIDNGTRRLSASYGNQTSTCFNFDGNFPLP